MLQRMQDNGRLKESAKEKDLICSQPRLATVQAYEPRIPSVQTYNRQYNLIQFLDQLNQMSLPLFHQDLCELFQRSSEQFIFSKLQKNDQSLQEMRPCADLGQQSEKAIKAIMQALMHLRLNLVMPCQIRPSYVVKRGQKWGLRHAICDRNQQQSEKGQEVYNPEEFKYHLDSQSQLMWNIGKIWLRFFTDKQIKIKYHKQEKIDALIEEFVPKREISQIIRQLLSWDCKKRISFQEFLNSDFFLKNENEEKSNFYSSVLGHLKNLSRIGLMTSKTKLAENEVLSPFTRQIRFRCFLEYLQVDIFLQGFCREMKKQYYLGEGDQRALCQFTLYITSLQNYMNMCKLNRERLQMGERFQELQHRLYYARFTKRIIMLKEYIQKTGKRLKKDIHLGRFAKFFANPDEILPSLIYDQFKSCLSEYAHFLNEDLKANRQDITALKLLTKIYIARTSSYVFSQMRSEVFEPFMRNQKSFNLKKVLSRVNECNDKDLLRALLINIKKFYFNS